MLLFCNAWIIFMKVDLIAAFWDLKTLKSFVFLLFMIDNH